MSNILVVGGSGYIGHRLVARLGRDRVIATYRSQPFPGGFPYDVGTMRLADRFLVGKHNISHAILLQGVTNIDQCALAPEETSRVNVEGTIRAIEDLLDTGAKPIFISSDGVFDGTHGPSTEGDHPCPILAYGRQKAAVEDYLRGVSAPWVTTRLSKVIGRFRDPRNLLSEWIDAIYRGRVIRCAYDQILSPIDVDDVVEALMFFTTGEASGLFNVSGSQALSRHDLLALLLSRVDPELRSAARVEICSLSDFSFEEPRPKNCSMSNQKFIAASGFTFRSPEEICEGLWRSYATGRRCPPSSHDEPV
jgi:dTDP-4-dehydrorhamnose reductase